MAFIYLSKLPLITTPRGRAGQEVSFYGMNWEVHTYLLVPSHGRGRTQSYGHTAREAEKCSLQLANHMHTQLKLKGKVDIRGQLLVSAANREEALPRRKLDNHLQLHKYWSPARPWMRKTLLLYMNMSLHYSYTCSLQKPCK